jgi:hypothetical protein
LSDRDDNRWVEHLYGELPEEEGQSVRRTLAADPKVADEVRGIERTLESYRSIPDDVPRPTLDALILFRAREEAEKLASAQPVPWWRKLVRTPWPGLVGAVATAAVVAGVVLPNFHAPRVAEEPAMIPAPASTATLEPEARFAAREPAAPAAQTAAAMDVPPSPEPSPAVDGRLLDLAKNEKEKADPPNKDLGVLGGAERKAPVIAAAPAAADPVAGSWNRGPAPAQPAGRAAAAAASSGARPTSKAPAGSEASEHQQAVRMRGAAGVGLLGVEGEAVSGKDEGVPAQARNGFSAKKSGAGGAGGGGKGGSKGALAGERDQFADGDKASPTTHEDSNAVDRTIDREASRRADDAKRASRAGAEKAVAEKSAAAASEAERARLEARAAEQKERAKRSEEPPPAELPVAATPPPPPPPAPTPAAAPTDSAAAAASVAPAHGSAASPPTASAGDALSAPAAGAPAPSTPGAVPTSASPEALREQATAQVNMTLLEVERLLKLGDKVSARRTLVDARSRTTERIARARLTLRLARLEYSDAHFGDARRLAQEAAAVDDLKLRADALAFAEQAAAKEATLPGVGSAPAKAKAAKPAEALDAPADATSR